MAHSTVSLPVASAASSSGTTLWRDALFRTSASFNPLFLRLAVAVVMFPHGAQKLLGAVAALTVSGGGAVSIDRALHQRNAA